ncbi:MAG: hypothetical protein LAT84_10295 [Balneolia bacterium]|nr:hypothetical protein [Balneolia bacterium]
MKKLLFAITLLVTSAMLVACSDDNGSSNDPFGDNVSFTVSGEVEASHSGFAEVIVFSSAGFTSWGLDAYDIENDTFFLQIDAWDGIDTINGTGTYTIGEADEADFFATYDRSGVDNLFTSVNGTLTITTLTSSRAAGSFQFDAVGFEGEQVSIRNGEFDARIFEGEF